MYICICNSEIFEPCPFVHPTDVILCTSMSSNIFLVPTGWESSRLLRKQLMEEHEHVLDLERRRLSELQLAQKSLANQFCFRSSMDELKVSEGLLYFLSYIMCMQFSSLICFSVIAFVVPVPFILTQTPSFCRPFQVPISKTSRISAKCFEQWFSKWLWHTAYWH